MPWKDPIEWIDQIRAPKMEEEKREREVSVRRDAPEEHLGDEPILVDGLLVLARGNLRPHLIKKREATEVDSFSDCARGRVKGQGVDDAPPWRSREPGSTEGEHSGRCGQLLPHSV
jgi:hypothetical protein